MVNAWYNALPHRRKFDFRWLQTEKRIRFNSTHLYDVNLERDKCSKTDVYMQLNTVII